MSVEEVFFLFQKKKGLKKKQTVIANVMKTMDTGYKHFSHSVIPNRFQSFSAK